MKLNRKFFAALLLLGGFVLSTHPALTQSYPVTVFTPQDGLPGLSVRSIFKDSRGLLWIGTDAGLCCYDGKSFRIFRESDGIDADPIWALEEDEWGNLWIGTLGEGVYRYNGKSFTRFTQKEGLPDNRVRALLYSRAHQSLFVGTNKGISVIRGDSVLPPPRVPADTQNRPSVMSLLEVGNQILVIAYDDQSPFRYDPVAHQMVSINDGGRHYPELGFSSLLTQKGDTVLSEGFTGIRILTGAGIHRNDTLGQVFAIKEDKRGDLWLASWSTQNVKLPGGIFRFDGQNYRNFQKEFGIRERGIFTLCYDREQDLLWIGTESEGLFRVSLDYLTLYTPDYFSMEDQRIRNLYVDDSNNLWISGTRELTKLNRDGSYSFLDKKPMIAAYRRFWKDPQIRKYPNMATTMLNAKNLQGKQLQYFIKNADFNFDQVLEDTDHSIIYACELGLFRYDYNTKQTDYLGQEGANGHFVNLGDTLIINVGFETAINPNYRKSRLHLDNSRFFPPGGFIRFGNGHAPSDVTHSVRHGKRVWYTTLRDGLWSSEGVVLVHHNQDSLIPKSLSAVCFDSAGRIMIGSYRGEILIGEVNGNQLNILHRISSENGLHGNTIFWLAADRDKYLWAGTNEGLNCISLDTLARTGRVLNRFLTEGNEILGHGAIQAVMDSAGNLWIAGKKNLLRLQTSKLPDHTSVKEPILLKAFRINEKPADTLFFAGFQTTNYFTGREFHFNHRERNLKFEFDRLNFRNPEEDLFRYKLVNYDSNWSSWGVNRRAAYTNLPPGHYQFRVESYNQRTLVSSEPLVIKFVIRHPWWKLWFIRVLTGILLLSLVIAGVRKYVQRERMKQQRKLEIERRMVQLEMEALEAQMNPHFVFNCMNDIQYYILGNETEKALNFVSDFSKLVRLIFKQASQRLVTLEQEISFLTAFLHLEKMRSHELFQYDIRMKGEQTVGSLKIPPMLIQPFVENAIRHGFHGLDRVGILSISFEALDEDLLNVTIEDNGIGRNLSALKKADPMEGNRPHSTQITENRIKLFNNPGAPEKYRIVYTDLLDDGVPCGLRVNLYLPVKTVEY